MAHSNARQARVHVLTVSDTRTLDTDESGNECIRICEENGHVVAGRALLPDEPGRVEAHCRSVAAGVDAILLNGGTGIAPRDTTYEAVSRLLDRRLDGFGELFRMLSFAEVGSRAMASRAVAGVFGKTLIFSMPGSTKAVRLAMTKLVVPELGHLVGELRKS
jgi:molybdenum cofactor biosynthesis protein B